MFAGEEMPMGPKNGSSGLSPLRAQPDSSVNDVIVIINADDIQFSEHEGGNGTMNIAGL
jgi:hypothetical protein